MKILKYMSARRLLSVLLCLAVLFAGMVWSGVGAATGKIDYDFEYNPGQNYAATVKATNNTYRENVRAWLRDDLSFAQSGSGAMWMSYLADTAVNVNPAFRIFDEDDTAFAPTKGAYYRITFSYYLETVNGDFEMRILFGSRSWASADTVTDSFYTLESVNSASKTGQWITVSRIVKCGYNRAHFALYAPEGGAMGTTVYIDDLKMEKITDTAELCTLTLDYGDGTTVTQYGEAGAYTPPTLLKAAYYFTGWYTDADCQTPYDGQLTGDTTLYAGWIRAGKVSHPGMMDFEHPYYANRGSINLSVGTAEVSDAYNHTGRGCYSLRVTTQSFNEIAGNTRPQFNLTDAAGTALRVKAGETYHVSFWVYVAETSAVGQVRYWLTVTESTEGYTNQKNDEVVYETNAVGSVGEWVRETVTISDLPRDGFLRLGICGQNENAAEFYVDDIHAVKLDSAATREGYEDYATEDVDFIHNGAAAITTGINRTEGGSRSLQLTGIGWGGLNRNQLTLVDPATREPYKLESGVYYNLSMWIYTTHSNFVPNVWLWGKDDPTYFIPTSADKSALADQFLYDGTAHSDAVSGRAEPGVWSHVHISFQMNEGPYLLMGITNGAVQNGGYSYFLDDVQVARAAAATITVVNGDSAGGTTVIDAYKGQKLGDVVSLFAQSNGELAGLYYDAEHYHMINSKARIESDSLTLYAKWRPWSGVCHHTDSCDTVCRLCGQVGAHQPSDSWSTDATGHWRACVLCDTYVTGDTHTYASACDGTCEVCGYDRGSSHTMVVRYTAAGHHAQCSACGISTAVVAHTYADANAPQCDSCGYVRYQSGDLDRDGDVDDQDVLILAYHLFVPEYYPFYQQADFNRDGKVNSDDALYLQNHLQDPAGYPLVTQQTPIISTDDDVYTLS